MAANGDLVIAAARGELRFRAPSMYQLSGKQISGGYTVRKDGTVGFTIGDYDHTNTLVIDPVVAYSSYLGGSDDEGIFGIQRDAAGCIYLSGETSSLNFPTKTPFQGQMAGEYDAFVSKFDQTGTHLIYSTYLGGSGYDHAVGLAIDQNGETYLAGLTTSTDFPVKNALQKVLKGQQNAFVTHLTRTGSELVFSTYLGGSGYDEANNVAIDRNHDIYIGGQTGSVDFPVTAGAYQMVCDGPGGLPGSCDYDGFAAKIASNGSKLIYSTFLGGKSFDGVNGIAVDSKGAAYLTGQTGSPDYPVVKAYQSALKGQANAFVTKLDPTGSKLEFSSYLGGSSIDGSSAIALGGDGEIYLAGQTSSMDFPLVKAFQTINHEGFFDSFVSRLSNDGSKLLNSSFLAGTAWTIRFEWRWMDSEARQ